MPILCRSATPIPRDILTSQRFASIDDPLARELYFRLFLLVDNLGLAPGDPTLLAGLIFPGHAPDATAFLSALQALEGAGLVFLYGPRLNRVVCVADWGQTQSTVGNMSSVSGYPAPPKQMVSAWEKRTSLKWTPLKNHVMKSAGPDNAQRTHGAFFTGLRHDARFSDLQDHMIKTFAERYGRKPAWRWQDFAALARILKGQPYIPTADFVLAWNAYMDDDEPFVVEHQGHSLAWFCTRFDAYANRVLGPHKFVRFSALFTGNARRRD